MEYKDAVQGGNPLPRLVYLAPLAKSRAHGAASQSGIESGRFGSDRGVFCSNQGVFSENALSRQGVFFAKNAPNKARSKSGPQIDGFLRRFAPKKSPTGCQKKTGPNR